MNILMVEDNVYVAKTLIRALRNKGHDVTWAPTVEHGEEKMTAGPTFHVVLLDQDVAGINGWALRERAPAGARVVLMTGNPPPNSPPHYLKGDPLEKLFTMIEG